MFSVSTKRVQTSLIWIRLFTHSHYGQSCQHDSFWSVYALFRTDVWKGPCTCSNRQRKQANKSTPRTNKQTNKHSDSGTISFSKTFVQTLLSAPKAVLIKKKKKKNCQRPDFIPMIPSHSCYFSFVLEMIGSKWIGNWLAPLRTPAAKWRLNYNINNYACTWRDSNGKPCNWVNEDKLMQNKHAAGRIGVRISKIYEAFAD